MKKLMLSLAIVTLAMAAQATFGQLNKTSFINNAKLLEKKPLDPNASSARESSFRWLVETDEVSVVLCSDFTKLLPEKKNKFKGELLMQMTFGAAVFKLENPARKSDEKAASLAGLESMLRAYEAMLAAEKKAQNADLDALLAKMKAGELAGVAENAACAK